MSEYTPTEHEVRLVWTEWSGWGGLTDRPDYDATRTEMRAEFDRFLARVRRDAVQQFIDACKAKRDEPGFLLPPNHWQDIEAAIRVAESYVKNHPEVTP